MHNVLFRGKDEDGGGIVIDIFNKKELDVALRQGRINDHDHVLRVEVLGKVDLRKPKKSKKG